MNLPLMSCSMLALTAAAAGDTYCGSGPATIPDGSGAACTWIIDVPPAESTRIITNARVLLDIDHPWVGDLSLELVAPDGTSMRLMDRVGMPDGDWIGPWGCGGDNIMCLLDDSASDAAETACALDTTPVLSGNLRPLESLSTFIGTEPSGAWTVIVTDHSYIDAGTITQICLTVESAPDCNANGSPDDDDIAGGSSEDTDGNGVPDECECLGDIDGNGSVDVSDLLTIIADWGCSTVCDGDANADGSVDVADLLAVISSWGDCA